MTEPRTHPYGVAIPDSDKGDASASAPARAWHHGRSWTGHPLEDQCPCPQEACGLVAEGDPECPEHGLIACKTIRQAHAPDQCPANAPQEPHTPSSGPDGTARAPGHAAPQNGAQSLTGPADAIAAINEAGHELDRIDATLEHSRAVRQHAADAGIIRDTADERTDALQVQLANAALHARVPHAPAWDDLPEYVRETWLASVRDVVDEVVAYGNERAAQALRDAADEADRAYQHADTGTGYPEGIPDALDHLEQRLRARANEIEGRT